MNIRQFHYDDVTRRGALRGVEQLSRTMKVVTGPKGRHVVLDNTRPMRRRAFTLPEMLAVVCVVAIVVSLLLPSLNQARYTARVALCATNIRQVTVGSLSYALDSTRNYPEDAQSGIRKQTYAAYPEGLADYIGGSVIPKDNRVLRCPQIESEGKPLADDNARHYQVYYNVAGSLKSGSVGINSSHAIPNAPIEAMPRTDSTRLTVRSSFFGGGIWESNIVASDIAQQWSAYVQTGHMRGGGRYTGGFGALKQWTSNATATANYSFRDGRVESYLFTAAEVADTMIVASSDGAGDWDKFLMPKNAIKSSP